MANFETDIKLGRIGHYHTPGGDGEQGTCQKADVVQTYPAAEEVNLVATTHEGNTVFHSNVPVALVDAHHATFHLNMECPYGR